jgi:YtcA family
MKTVYYALCSFVVIGMTAGCARNPNVEIVGSYFPGWMISLAIGVLLTGITHTFLRRRGLVHTVGHPAVIYPSMIVLFTTLPWLCFFA